MGTLSNLKYLIEALRGGDTPVNKAALEQNSLRSTYNPEGIEATSNTIGPPLRGPHSPSGFESMSGIHNSDYMKYLKSAQNPKPYEDWLSDGGV